MDIPMTDVDPDKKEPKKLEGETLAAFEEHFERYEQVHRKLAQM